MKKILMIIIVLIIFILTYYLTNKEETKQECIKNGGVYTLIKSRNFLNNKENKNKYQCIYKLNK